MFFSLEFIGNLCLCVNAYAVLEDGLILSSPPPPYSPQQQHQQVPIQSPMPSVVNELSERLQQLTAQPENPPDTSAIRDARAEATRMSFISTFTAVTLCEHSSVRLSLCPSPPSLSFVYCIETIDISVSISSHVFLFAESLLLGCTA